MEIDQLYQRYLQCSSVSTDTRHISEGALFFALKGPNFNANAFAVKALEKGAHYAIVDEKKYVLDERYIWVEDSLKALQSLANHHRRQLSIPFIAITGSNGKTTTKELIQAVLSKRFHCLATKGNLNNHIGVPLTLLSIDSKIEIAVIEMGANHLGDIQELCGIAVPDHGLITNIGRAHIGEFGGFENIIRGKSELYQHLIQQEGTVWINSQDKILRNMSKRFSNPLFYPGPEDYSSSTFIEATPFIKYRSEQGEVISTQIVGKYNFENIAAALCVGKYFGVDPEKANTAIAEYFPENNRSQVIRKESNTIIMDAYNANPSSMEVAIENLAQVEGKKKIILLGDMYELGEESEAEHEKLGVLTRSHNFDEVYFCGKLIRAALKGHPEALYFKTKEELIASLQHKKFKNSTLLFKASRSIGLESVFEAIQSTFF